MPLLRFCIQNFSSAAMSSCAFDNKYQQMTNFDISYMRSIYAYPKRQTENVKIHRQINGIELSRTFISVFGRKDKQFTFSSSDHPICRAKVMVKLSPLIRAAQTIYVSNIPWTCTSKEVIEYLRRFGCVTSGNVYFDAKTGLSKNYGVFEVNDDRFLEKIMKESDLKLEGNILCVALNEDKRLTGSNCVKA